MLIIAKNKLNTESDQLSAESTKRWSEVTLQILNSGPQKEY